MRLTATTATTQTSGRHPLRFISQKIHVQKAIENMIPSVVRVVSFMASFNTDAWLKKRPDERYLSDLQSDRPCRLNEDQDNPLVNRVFSTADRTSQRSPRGRQRPPKPSKMAKGRRPEPDRSQRFGRLSRESVFGECYGVYIVLIIVVRGPPVQYRTANAASRRFYARNRRERSEQIAFRPHDADLAVGMVRPSGQTPLTSDGSRARCRAACVSGCAGEAAPMHQR